ncbi:MAG: tandem-95 repeat protein, partial [Magnetococcales bacterium]|nr:tandem-95 repeat protein [Magnetococcales bacterium]
VGVVSATSALLLRSADRIRFIPDGQNADSATLTFQAWDQTSGAAGSKVDASVHGGTTAFSTVSDTATVTVMDVNDAPILAAIAPTLTSVTEDTTGHAGDTVASLLGASMTDVDTGAVQGMAITALVSGNGVWQYNIGAGWTDIGVVSATSALLLRSTDSLRFVPDGENAETASFTYQAWDQISGAAGSKVDATASGGTTSISTGSDTATITVTAVNDAPVLTAASPLLTTIAEDAATNPGDTIDNLLGASVTDVDAGAAQGVAITSLTSGRGVWQYNTGAGWSDVGAVSTASALLLRGADSIRFVPDGLNADSATFTYQAWDQTSGAAGSKVDVTVSGGTTAFGTASDTATLAVAAVNDAPLMVATAPSLTTMTEDDTANAGDTVASLLGASVTDVDTGAVQGMAITSLTSGQGVWQYNTGAGWTDVGVVSASSALLLRSTDNVRFVPDGKNADSATFTYQAWDQTSGVAGNKVDTVASGGTTAFSTTSDTASITVTAVNDLPDVTVQEAAAYLESGPVTPVAPDLALVDVDSGEVMIGATVTIVGNYQSGKDVLSFAPEGNISGHWDAASGALTLTGADTVANYQAALRQVTFAHLGQDPTATGADRTLRFVVRDGVSESEPSLSLLHVTAVDNAPTVSTPDAFTVVEGSTGVLDGTALGLSDPDNTPDAVLVTLTQLPGHGQLLRDGVALGVGSRFTQADLTAGRIVYRNDGSEASQDRFIAEVSDMGGASSGQVTVHVQMSPVNDAPTITVPDAQTTDEDHATSIAGIRIADVDAAPTDRLSVTLADFHGHITLTHTDGLTFTLGGNGQSAMRFEGTTTDLNAALASLVYQGQADWNGQDVLSIQINDQANLGPLWSAATVTMTVRTMSDAPTAGMDALTTTEDTPLDIATGSDLLGNDVNPDNNVLTLSEFTQGMHGQVILNPDSTFTYIPNHHFTGLDRFSYTIEDAAGHATTAVVSVVVNPAVDGLHAGADRVTTQQEQSVTIGNPLANDWDARYAANDGHNPDLQIIGFTRAAHGQVLYNADGTFTYRPEANYTGQDKFTYTLSDGGNRIDQGEVTIDVTPATATSGNAGLLQIHDDAVTTRENEPITIANVLANDTDPGYLAKDGHNPAMKVAGFSGATHGTVTYREDGYFVYQPHAGFSGTDQFSYMARTPDGRYGVATVKVTVDPLHDTAHEGTPADTTASDRSPINFSLTTDPFKDVLTPGSPVTYTTSGMPQWLTFDPDKLSFSGYATRNDAGVYTITVTATDGTGLSASGNFQLTVANSTPGMDGTHAGHKTGQGESPRFVVKQSLMEVALNRAQGRGNTQDGSAATGRHDGPSISTSGTELLTTWRSDSGPSVRLSQNISGTQLIATTRQDMDGGGGGVSQDTSGTRLITRVQHEGAMPVQSRTTEGSTTAGGRDADPAGEVSSIADVNQALNMSNGVDEVGGDPANMATRERSSTAVAIDALTGEAGVGRSGGRVGEVDSAGQTEAAWSRARQNQVARGDQESVARVASSANLRQATRTDGSGVRDTDEAERQGGPNHGTAQSLAASVLGRGMADEWDPRTIAAKERKAGAISTRPGLTRQLQSSNPHLSGHSRLAHLLKR